MSLCSAEFSYINWDIKKDTFTHVFNVIDNM